MRIKTVYFSENRHNSTVGFKQILPNVGLCSLYKILLEYIYIFLLSQRWGYGGFTYEGMTVVSYCFSWIIVIIASCVITWLQKKDSFSSTIIQSLLIISFIPGIVMYTFKTQEIMLLFLFYWASLLFFYSFTCDKVRRISFNTSESVLSYLAFLFFVFCFFIWARYSHFHVQLDLFDVYGLRQEAANYNMPKVFAYLFESIQVCVPFLAVWALGKSKYSIFLLLVVTQILCFFSGGAKSTFFSLIVGIIVNLISNTRKNTRYSSKIILVGMTSTGVLCYVERLITHTYFLLDYLYRRILFLPNLLNIYYHDYFSSHEKDYFRSSILRYLGFQSPYTDLKIQNIIGGTYFGQYSMYTNNGLFSDAYANLGIMGIIVLPLLIVLLLRFFDSCMGKVNLGVRVSASVYVVICLIGSSFFTNLFSHGFIMLAFLACFLQQDDIDRAPKKNEN